MFSGSFVAIVTPMRFDGALDYDAWERLLAFHQEQGTRGIVVGGTTGESAALTDTELAALVERACRFRDRHAGPGPQAGRRMAIVAGAGTSNTASTVARVRALNELPIDGLLVVTPAYVRPTQEGLYRHFAAVAEAARVPVIAYNVPTRTAVDMLPATVVRLAQLPRIRALKEAVADMKRVRELAAGCGPDFEVLSGDDGTAREAMYAGARGVISVTANVAPGLMRRLCDAALKGDRGEADRIDSILAPLHAALFMEPSPTPAKWALAKMGLIAEGIRLPLLPLSAGREAELSAILRTVGVLK